MKTLNRFETDLNRILRCLFGQIPLAATLPLLTGQSSQPKCLTRDCVDLVQDTLAKGCTRALAMFGWQTANHCINDSAVVGRLWQRHAPTELAMTFSKQSMEFLIELTATNFTAVTDHKFTSRSASATVGDQVLGLMTFQTLHNTLAEKVLLGHPMISRNALVRLLFVDRVADLKNPAAIDWDWWFAKDNVWVMEAIQNELASKWSAIESKKRQMSDSKRLRKIGRLQSELLDQYFAAADSVGRRDLCAFLIYGLGDCMQKYHPDRERWLQSVGSVGRLAERRKLFETALSPFHKLQTLAKWQQDAQDVSFYDEEYRASQFWKSMWESCNGDDVYRRSQQLIKSVTPL